MKNHTEKVKQTALQIGFDSVGISKPQFLENEAPRLEQWLNNNYHGEMAYMANYFDKRLDPRKLFPNCKSIISLVINYYPEEKQIDKAPKISKYAYGRDYHKVIKKKCKSLISKLQVEIGDFSGRAFVDSAPVMDKVWAQKSGLGWIGKNANLINNRSGSFFFIAEILCDLELAYDLPIKDYCGTCTKCIDACPTDAIVQPYVVDGSKCISYFTIELKKEMPNEYKNKLDNWLFGCDICQDVCPWNKFSKPHNNEGLKANDKLLNMNWDDWNEITEDVFDSYFIGSPLRRSKFDGIKRNYKALIDSEKTLKT